MLKLKTLLILSLILPTKLLINIPSIQAQTGNQSNITGPDPIESIPFNPPTPATPTTQNQEDNQQQTGNVTLVTKEVSTVQEIKEIVQSIDRNAVIQIIETGNVDLAIQTVEQVNALEHSSVYDAPLTGAVDTSQNISNDLASLASQTGTTATINYLSLGNNLTILTITPDNIQGQNITEKLWASKQLNNIVAQNDNESPTIFRNTIPLDEESRSQLDQDIIAFRNYLTDPFSTQKDYLEVSARLYDYLIRPITANLQNKDIDTLTFVLGDGLRGIPLAALYNRETGKYLIEEYSIGVIPSFGLTNVNYQKPDLTNILAAGSSTFTKLEDLPAVPLELTQVVNSPRRGEILLNQEFSIDNFKRQNQNQRFDVIHIATHAEFLPGSLDSSYIQFFDNQLTIPQVVELARDLQWGNLDKSAIELLVLSACQTSVGSKEAELGFAGISVGLGVKSVLASMWSVSDLGTFALMSQFYENYTNMPLKAEALRQAQISLLKKEVYMEDDFIILANGKRIPVPDNLKGQNVDLSDPFIWAAFQLIGNWN